MANEANSMDDAECNWILLPRVGEGHLEARFCSAIDESISEVQ
jgi:hypothetical protein